MSKSSAYDFSSTPLVVGRVPSLPVAAAVTVLSAPDPLEATRQFYASNAFARTAIAVTSPSLLQALNDWIDGKATKNPKLPERALSYLIRMATRPTPFGLFSGVGNVEIGDRTTLEVDSQSSGRRSYTRADMGLMVSLSESLERGETLERISYRTNDCAFIRGDRLYVINIALANYNTDVRQTRAEQREISLKNTEAVTFVRRLCVDALSYAEIVAALCVRFEAQEEQGRKLLDSLIKAGVVTSELRPSPLGDPTAYLLERFEHLEAPFAAELRSAVSAANELDEKPLAQRTPEEYQGVLEQFSSINSGSATNCVQVDLRATITGELGREILSDVEFIAEANMRMGRVMTLETYRNRFMDRYEGSERMVPLLELVDNNIGLGVPDETTFEQVDSSKRDAAIMQLACEAMRINREEIVLDQELVDIFLPKLASEEDFAPSLEVGFQVAAASKEDIETGNYRMIPGFMSDVGGRSLGRFVHMLGDGVVDRMQELAARTMREGEIVAEFAYAPVAGRAYNVSTRPLLYDAEVRAGIGAPPHGEAISPDDLWVGIENDRFFLWSKSRERRVSVRETHALTTYTSAPNLCRFLALLHLDGKRLPGVNWGPASELTYLPRLRHNRVVLSLRRWRFPRELFGKNRDEAARALDRLREQWAFPRYVCLVEEDNRLLLDLDSPAAAILFNDQAPEGTVHIEEVLPLPDQAWLNGATGSHVIEFIAQGVLRKKAEPVTAISPVLPASARRTYGPGSEWIYAKLYLGSQAIDNFIVTALMPLVNDLQNRNLVDRWFFLRYADPQTHLRFRVHASSPSVASAVREELLVVAQRWLGDTKLLRYALDTYDPEYERYGGEEALDAAELFFAFDSHMCAAILSDGITDTAARIEAAATTFDAMLAQSETLGKLTLDAFSGMSKTKLESRDRESVRRIGSANPIDVDRTLLERALEGAHVHKRLRDLVHMHCNRLGLTAESERRVCLVLRAAALARQARQVSVPVTS